MMCDKKVNRVVEKCIRIKTKVNTRYMNYI